MDHNIRARAVRIAAALVLVSGGFVGIHATPALAHPEVCETGHGQPTRPSRRSRRS